MRRTAHEVLDILKQSYYFKGVECRVFFIWTIMATNPSIYMNGDQEEFLSGLIGEIIANGNLTVIEARNTATWLNSIGSI